MKKHPIQPNFVAQLICITDIFHELRNVVFNFQVANLDFVLKGLL